MQWEQIGGQSEVAGHHHRHWRISKSVPGQSSTHKLVHIRLCNEKASSKPYHREYIVLTIAAHANETLAKADTIN